MLLRRTLHSFSSLKPHIISGSSHPSLAESLANRLKAKLSVVDYTQFANAETRLKPLHVNCNEDIYIVHSPRLDINDQIMELLLTTKACKQQHNTRVTAVLPCFPYSRSDKSEFLGLPIAAKLVADLLKTAGVDNIITVDLHAAQIEGFFSVPISNLSTIELVCDSLKGRDVVLVAPDAGAMKRVTQLSERLGLPFSLIHKERGPDGGISQMTLVGDVSKKTAVIVDDMADTCGTVLKASSLLRASGAASVEAFMTHGLLSGPAIDRINQDSSVDRFTVTNTLCQKQNIETCSKLHVVSVTELLASRISKLISFDR